MFLRPSGVLIKWLFSATPNLLASLVASLDARLNKNKSKSSLELLSSRLTSTRPTIKSVFSFFSLVPFFCFFASQIKKQKKVHDKTEKTTFNPSPWRDRVDNKYCVEIYTKILAYMPVSL